MVIHDFLSQLVAYNLTRPVESTGSQEDPDLVLTSGIYCLMLVKSLDSLSFFSCKSSRWHLSQGCCECQMTTVYKASGQP